MSGRPFLVTKKVKSKVQQSQFTLHAALKDSEIRKLVQQGVPMECFEANPDLSPDRAEKAMEDLRRFVVNVADQQQRLQPTTRTTLEDFGTPKRKADLVVVAPTAPAGVSSDKIELKLIKAGIPFDLAATASVATADELAELDWRTIKSALELANNAGPQKVYEEMRK